MAPTEAESPAPGGKGLMPPGEEDPSMNGMGQPPGPGAGAGPGAGPPVEAESTPGAMPVPGPGSNVGAPGPNVGKGGKGGFFAPGETPPVSSAESNIVPPGEQTPSMFGTESATPGGAGFQAPAPPRKLTIRERAEDAFKKGHEKEARALLEAHILTAEDPSEIVDQFRWSKLRKQPQLTARIAVGVELKAPPRVTSYNPISATGNGNGDGMGGESGGGMGRPGMVGGPGGGNASGTSNKGLVDITGDMGKLLIDHVKELHEKGALGSVFSGLEVAVNPAAGASSDGMGMAMGMEAESVPGPGGRPGMGMGGQPAASPVTGKLGIPNRNRLAPGLTYLGTDDSANDLMDKALAEGYDLVVIYNVTIEQNRMGNVMNDCRARVYIPGDKKHIATTESYNNVDTMRKMQKGDSGIIEKAMGKLFAKMDEAATLADLPTNVGAEAIARRVDTLKANKAKNVLETLAEVKLWNRKQLLGPSEMESAFAAILSPDAATKLVAGTEDERADLLKKYLP